MVPEFDLEAMILSILHDWALIQPKNFAEGLDIFSGDVNEGYESNNNYGKIQIGDAWKVLLCNLWRNPACWISYFWR